MNSLQLCRIIKLEKFLQFVFAIGVFLQVYVLWNRLTEKAWGIGKFDLNPAGSKILKDFESFPLLSWSQSKLKKSCANAHYGISESYGIRIETEFVEIGIKPGYFMWFRFKIPGCYLMYILRAWLWFFSPSSVVGFTRGRAEFVLNVLDFLLLNSLLNSL